jgi:hypothetical protein
MIEQQPYTAVAIALGVGWLLGRMHRPLSPATSIAGQPCQSP